MGVECFFDTNVLVYAASSAPEDEPKKERALEATILYTEDLSDGQSYGSVVARNPFRPED